MITLFSTNPFYGHYHPLSSLASALTDSNHKVVFATTDGFAPIINADGFMVLSAGVDPFSSSGWDETVTRRKVNDLLASCSNMVQPDLVVRETSDFAGMLVAEILGIPHVTVGAGLYIDTSWWRRLLGGSLDRIRAPYGVTPDPACTRLHKYMYLDLVPPWFQHFPGRRPKVHQFFTVDREPEMRHPAPNWLRHLSDRPTVYVTLGTVYNAHLTVFRTVLRALADEAVNVICTVGQDQDPNAIFAERRPSNAVLRRYIPQGHILPRCDVIVTHGGYNTLVGALRHNVLPVVIPLGADQPLNAQRCVDLRVGLCIQPSQLTEEAVRTAVLSLLNAPGRRQRLQRLRLVETAVPALDEAVTALERVAQEQSAWRR